MKTITKEAKLRGGLFSTLVPTGKVFFKISWSALISLVDDAFHAKNNWKTRWSKVGYPSYTSPGYEGASLRYYMVVLANFRATVYRFRLFSLGRFSFTFLRISRFYQVCCHKQEYKTRSFFCLTSVPAFGNAKIWVRPKCGKLCWLLSHKHN